MRLKRQPKSFMLIAAKESSSCTTFSLFLFRENDSVHCGKTIFHSLPPDSHEGTL
jgi:hypothetical protein